MTEKFRPQFPTKVDSTMLSVYKSCSYKMYLEHVRGMASPKKSIHLHFGGLMASACEFARKAFYMQEASAPEAVSLGSEYILRNFGDVDEDVGPKTLKNAVWAFENYMLEAYPLGQDRFVPYRSTADGLPMIEFSFAIPTEVSHPETGEPILYAGRSDMIAVDSKTFPQPHLATEVWILDEKTTQQMGGSWAQQFRLRSQFLGYTWAARCHDIPAVGALVRGICVYKRNEPKFNQAFVQFNDTLIDHWHEQLIDTLQQMYNDWTRGYWPQDFDSACAAYGGCGFINTCEMADPEPYYQSKYVERRWDPLNRIEVEGEQ